MFPILLSCDWQSELAKAVHMRIMSMEVWSHLKKNLVKKNDAIYSRIKNPNSGVQIKTHFIAFER